MSFAFPFGRLLGVR